MGHSATQKVGFFSRVKDVHVAEKGSRGGSGQVSGRQVPCLLLFTVTMVTLACKMAGGRGPGVSTWRHETGFYHRNGTGMQVFRFKSDFRLFHFDTCENYFVHSTFRASFT